MDTIHIPVVLGTARVGRQSDKVASAIVDCISQQTDLSSELVDVKDHIREAITVPPWGEGGANDSPTAWKEIVGKAKALVLVVPEYNHGYPGELKLLLDSLWEEYKGMPVALVGVSAGTLGGARVIDHIKPVLIEMHLRPIREAVTFSKVKEAFNEDGSLKDERTTEYIQKVVAALVEESRRG